MVGRCGDTTRSARDKLLADSPLTDRGTGSYHSPFAISVMRSPCVLSPSRGGVAPSVPWLMLSWTGALVALATFGQPVVTLHPWHICVLRATRALSRKLELRLLQGRESLAHVFPLRSALSLAHVFLLRSALSLAHVFLLRFILSFSERLLGCLLDPSPCTYHHFAS